MQGKKGIVHLFGGSLFGKAVSFILNIFLSRCLGPLNLGIFGLILSTAQTFEILTRAGIDFGLQHELTKSETKEEETFNQTVASALSTVDFLSICLGGVLLVWLLFDNFLASKGASVDRELIIFCAVIICLSESLTSISWEAFLLSGKTKLYALRSAVYHPIKILFAVIAASIGGLNMAVAGYTLIGALQAIIIRRYTNFLIHAKNTKAQIRTSKKLIKKGLPFFATNAINSCVFLPLLAEVATSTGFKEVGFLRIGQFVVQLFTLLPGAVAPVLFIKLRLTSSTDEQQKNLGLSLESIWCIGLITLALYLLVDKYAILLIFGQQYMPAMVFTRALVMAAILESLCQILYSNVLAQNRMIFYSATQISSSILAALLGMTLIPKIGAEGFILAKIVHSSIPMAIYLYDAFSGLPKKKIVMSYVFCTILILPLCIAENIYTGYTYSILAMVFIFASRRAIMLRKAY